MARTRFEELEVYRLSEELADVVWEIVLKWPTLARDTVGKQLVRAADSIGANIAEGDGRGTFIENRRFCRIGRGSLQETQHWLRRAYRRKLLAPKHVEKLQPLVATLGPKLNAYSSSMTRLIRSQGKRKDT